MALVGLKYKIYGIGIYCICANVLELTHILTYPAEQEVYIGSREGSGERAHRRRLGLAFNA